MNAPPASTSVEPTRPRGVSGCAAGLLVLMVRGYQVMLGPLLGGHCRFEPTCSQYFIEAVHKYGPVRGAARGVGRICRCHPFRPGGYDPP